MKYKLMGACLVFFFLTQAPARAAGESPQFATWNESSGGVNFVMRQWLWDYGTTLSAALPEGTEKINYSEGTSVSTGSTFRRIRAYDAAAALLLDADTTHADWPALLAYANAIIEQSAAPPTSDGDFDIFNVTFSNTNTTPFARTFFHSPPWPGGNELGPVPSSERSAKAFVRVENSYHIAQRNVALVWEESINSELATRYYVRIFVDKNNPTALVQSSNQLGNFYMNEAVVNLTIDSPSQWSPTMMNGTVRPTVCLVPAAGPGSQNAVDYRSILKRFARAYERDHGSSANGLLVTAINSTDALLYLPAPPEGSQSFDYWGNLATNPPPVTSLVPRFTVPGSLDGTGTGGGSGGGSTGGWPGPTPRAIPGNAGTKAPVLTDFPAFGQSFGLAIGSWSSFLPTTQDPVVIRFDIPWTEGTTQSFFFTSVPSDGTPMGAALNSLRMLVRSSLVVFIVWQFLSRVYRDLVLY